MNMRINRYDITKINKLRFKTEKKILELPIEEELSVFEFKTNNPGEGEDHPVRILNNLRLALLKAQGLKGFHINVEFDFNEDD